MLEQTRATTFAPGTNLKGAPAGAGWTYALPSLELGRVLCAGLPDARALATLARLAERVEVACGPLGRRRLRRLGLPNVGAAAGGEGVDLIVVPRRGRRPPLERLAPGGILLERPAVGNGAVRPAPPPRYVCELAAEAGLDVSRHRWTLTVPGDYASRKVTLRLLAPGAGEPEAVVKLTRAPAFNARLENERRALDALERAGVGGDGSVPRTLFAGTHAGLAVVGETAVAGIPFRRLTSARPDCPLAARAVEWLVDLGARTAHPGDPAEAGAVLDGLFARYRELYAPEPEERAFLAAQIDSLRRSAAFPLVFQHGDPGTWNLLATGAGAVGFLDWEAAEPDGMPLWDLFYLLRSFGVTVARAGGVRDSLRGLARGYLADTELARRLAAATADACDRAGVAVELVEPLFYTCWMHRALKEACRLPSRRLRRGHYVRLLRLCIAERRAPGLRLLFAGAGG